MLKFSVVIPPTSIEPGLGKYAFTTGPATPENTVSVAVPPDVPVVFPVSVMFVGVLLFVSTAVSVTLTPKLHDAPAASDPPDMFRDVEPDDTLLIDPEQELNWITPVIERPPVKLSVNAMPLIAVV